MPAHPRNLVIATAFGALVATAASFVSPASAAESTTLTAAPYVGVGVETENGVSITHAAVQGYRATLTVNGTDVPVVGRSVVFTSGDQTTCTAVTNAKGVAQCNLLTAPPVPDGYTATFAGDDAYLGSSASAPLVG